MNFVINKIKRISDDIFITNLSFLTLLFLWFFNPSNKGAVATFFVFFIILLAKTKDNYLSLFITYLVSSIIFTGKTHVFQLFDLKQFFHLFPYLKEAYPLGFTQQIVINSTQIVLFATFFFLIKDIIVKKIVITVDSVDIYLIFLLFWIIIANTIVSKQVFLSLYHTTFLVEVVILSFLLKVLVQDRKKSKSKIILNVFCIIILFQSFISFSQFVNSSLLGINIEVGDYPRFGGVAEESFFIFRPPGTFIHPNNLAVYLVALFPIVLCLFIIDLNRIYLVTLICGLMTIMLTLSRTAWLSLFISLLFVLYHIEHGMKINLWQIFKKYLFIFCIFFLPLIWYVSPRVIKTVYTFGNDGGMTLRLKQAEVMIILFKSSPVFGVGSGLSVIEAIKNTKLSVFSSFPSKVHNFYLLILAENGLVGITILFLFIIIILKTSWFKLRKLKYKKSKILMLGILGGILVIIISPLTQPFFEFYLLIIFYRLKDFI